MDVSAFSEENFDPLKWINDTFRNIDEHGGNKESHLSSMVTKLQLYVQEVNNALEETSRQVLENMPKVMHETEVIKKEAVILKGKMTSVKAEIAEIERGTDRSMAALERLDRIKTELQKSKQALDEADNWTVLANDIEDAFEAHNVEKVSATIVSLEESLAVLAKSGDSENRRLQLEGFKNRLEAAVSPLVVKALTSSNIEESRKYVSMFNEMGRSSQLIKYFSKCQRGALCQQWANTIDLDQDQAITDWLKTFYMFLMSNWHTQVKWCMAVFKSTAMLPRIYCDVLETLEGNMLSCIDSALKQQHDHLPYLLLLKESTDYFCSNLRTAMQQQGWEESSIVEVEGQAISLYLRYMESYRELAERHLLAEMGTAPSTSDLLEAVHNLQLRNSLVAQATHAALTDCTKFTHSVGFPALSTALQYCLLRYIEEYRNILRQIEMEKSNKEEWSMFKICLSLLQRIGELLLELKKADQALVQAFNCSSSCSSREKAIRKALLKNKLQAEYNEFKQKLKNGGGVLGDVVTRVERTCSKVYQVCVGVMTNRVTTELASSRTIWLAPSSTPVSQPDYSYAPLEYITQIGEYLMTVPQHLEPYTEREDGGCLSAALACLDQSAAPADLLLGSIARLTCSHYTDLILSLSYLSPHAAKQLSIDINYLKNVLEDLGFGLSDNLQHIWVLLQIPPEKYQLQSSSCPARLVAAVRHLRNITGS